MPYVYSTATCPCAYVEYEPSPATANHAKVLKRVSINGGHGVATKNLITPKGVVTQVSDADLDFLLQNKAFQRHIARGFITYDKKKIDPEKRAAEMAKGDGSAPLTPNDFKPGKSQEDMDTRIFAGMPPK
jgi:hypothetical protein